MPRRFDVDFFFFFFNYTEHCTWERTQSAPGKTKTVPPVCVKTFLGLTFDCAMEVQAVVDRDELPLADPVDKFSTQSTGTLKQKLLFQVLFSMVLVFDRRNTF